MYGGHTVLLNEKLHYLYKPSLHVTVIVGSPCVALNVARMEKNNTPIISVKKHTEDQKIGL